MLSHWRDYCLIVAFGWTLEEVDRSNALRCDWLIKVHEVAEDVARWKAEKARAASESPARSGHPAGPIRGLELLPGGAS